MDYERTIRKLECCATPGGCNDCPDKMDTTGCGGKLYKEAAEALEEAVKTIEHLEHNLGGLLSYVTNGRYSKADYCLEEMCMFVDDALGEECEKCDTLAAAEKENLALKHALAKVDIDCAYCAHKEEHARECMAADCECEQCAAEGCACRKCHEAPGRCWVWGGSGGRTDV